MAPQPEVERLLRDIDKVLAKYSSSKDREVQKVIQRFRRRRRKLDAKDALDTSFKIAVLADKIREWIEQTPWT